MIPSRDVYAYIAINRLKVFIELNDLNNLNIDKDRFLIISNIVANLIKAH
jgi:hypothetical protein